LWVEGFNAAKKKGSGKGSNAPALTAADPLRDINWTFVGGKGETLIFRCHETELMHRYFLFSNVPQAVEFRNLTEHRHLPYTVCADEMYRMAEKQPENFEGLRWSVIDWATEVVTEQVTSPLSCAIIVSQQGTGSSWFSHCLVFGCTQALEALAYSQLRLALSMWTHQTTTITT
jgi:hypothetical protein